MEQRKKFDEGTAWVPLILSLPLSMTPFMRGMGGLFVLSIPLLFLLSILSIFFQGKGVRLISALGLFVGYAIPFLVLILRPTETDPGPGEGLELVFYIYGMIVLGTLFATLTGYWMRLQKKDQYQ